MIIDLILNRKEGQEYKAKTFYQDIVNYGEIGFEIAEALDNGEEEDIKRQLAHYIIDGDYNIDIIKYIYSVEWLKDNNK